MSEFLRDNFIPGAPAAHTRFHIDVYLRQRSCTSMRKILRVNRGAMSWTGGAKHSHEEAVEPHSLHYATPNFLSSLLVLIHFMRLSSRRGAHEALSNATWQKSGYAPAGGCDSPNEQPYFDRLEAFEGLRPSFSAHGRCANVGTRQERGSTNSRADSRVHPTLNLPQASRLGMTNLLHRRVHSSQDCSHLFNEFVIPTGAYPDFRPRSTRQGRVRAFP
jgi:hypothetical protein